MGFVMKNILGNLKGMSMKNIIFTCLLLSTPCLSYAASFFEKPMAEQCKLALEETDESYELLASFLNRWAKDNSDISSIDREEFDRYKKSHFDPGYKSLVSRFKVYDTATVEQSDSSPVIKSNDSTLRTRFIVIAIEKFTRDKNKDELRKSYKLLKSNIIDNEKFIRKICVKKK